MSAPKPAAHDLDRAAQVLVDDLGRDDLIANLRDQMNVEHLPEAMKQRLRMLREIPFRAVLTLNFDGLLSGMLPGPESYEVILRSGGAQWWDSTFWDQKVANRNILNLHGNVRSNAGTREVVLSRVDYRRRLYRDPAYVNFLRTIFSTHDVLFLGVSFSDAYLNELRSEVLAMLGYDGQRQPGTVAYAIIDDPEPAVTRNYRAHEGIEVLPYDTHNRTDFSGFDRWLERIHDATCTQARLGALLSGKRILWLDDTPDARVGRDVLLSAARQRGGADSEVAVVSDVAEALDCIKRNQQLGRAYDLIISMWNGAHQPPWGVTMLEEVRRQNLPSPVIIFAGKNDAEARKPAALKLGALAYCMKFETLFKKIAEVFGRAEDTW